MRKYRKIDFREVINLDAFKGAGKVIPKIYDDIFQPSAHTIGQSINGPLKLVTIPLRLLGPFSNILECNINNWLEDKLKNVPEDERIVPKTNVAFPIMQNLIINLDDDTLRDAFLNLLANAISEKNAQSVQKYFPYILEQMTASDALLFKELYDTLCSIDYHLRRNQAIMNINTRLKGDDRNSQHTIYPNFFASTILPTYSDAVLSFENLVRLQILEITYDRQLVNTALYDDLQQKPLVKDTALRLSSTEELAFEEGMFFVTSLGRAFGSVVLSPPE